MTTNCILVVLENVFKKITNYLWSTYIGQSFNGLLLSVLLFKVETVSANYYARLDITVTLFDS